MTLDRKTGISHGISSEERVLCLKLRQRSAVGEGYRVNNDIVFRSRAGAWASFLGYAGFDNGKSQNNRTNKGGVIGIKFCFS